MNIIGLLMAEHASLRIHFRYVREGRSDSIFEVEDFVRNCHAKIEDELVFPKLEDFFSKSQESKLRQNLSRLEADHRLIEKIGEQIKSATVQGEEELLRKRIMLYANTVEIHNTGEETMIFPHWTQALSIDAGDLNSSAMRIVEEFGRERYFRVSGVSGKMLESLE